MAGARLGGGCICVDRRTFGPLAGIGVKDMNIICSFSVIESSENDNFIIHLAASMLIDLRWSSIGRTSTNSVPVHRLQVEAEHALIDVVIAAHYTADDVHIFADDDALVM